MVCHWDAAGWTQLTGPTTTGEQDTCLAGWAEGFGEWKVQGWSDQEDGEQVREGRLGEHGVRPDPWGAWLGSSGDSSDQSCRQKAVEGAEATACQCWPQWS